MKKSILAIILIIATVAGAFGLLTHNKNKSKATIAERQGVTMDVPVKLFAVEKQSLNRKIKINGVLAAKKQVTVLAEAAGQVQKIYKEVGEAVQIGTQLALLDGYVMSTQLETAKASLANSQRDLERFQRLAETGAATQQTVDQLRLAVEAANANVVALQKQVSNTTVKSPQRGVVVRRMVEVGSVIGGGSPTFMVADLSQMVMNVGLTEREIVQVKLGMQAAISIDALNADFPATISNIGIAADMSGRYNVEVQIKPNGKNELLKALRPDLLGSVSFDLPPMENTILIPRDALVDGVKDPKVYVVQDGKANMRRIVLGLIEGTNAVVIDGLALNEQIVVTGHQNLYENASVRILK